MLVHSKFPRTLSLDYYYSYFYYYSYHMEVRVMDSRLSASLSELLAAYSKFFLCSLSDLCSKAGGEILGRSQLMLSQTLIHFKVKVLLSEPVYGLAVDSGWGCEWGRKRTEAKSRCFSAPSPVNAAGFGPGRLCVCFCMSGGGWLCVRRDLNSIQRFRSGNAYWSPLSRSLGAGTEQRMRRACCPRQPSCGGLRG